MPNVFGRDVQTVEEIVKVFQAHGDDVRGTYRARYQWSPQSDAYSSAILERPSFLRDNPAHVVFPWEQIFLAAATCAGADYPMIAAHLGAPLDRVEFVVEGVFDPRGEFHGLGGFDAPADAAPCYISLHLRATLRSTARRDVLEKIHRHVVERNMVLGALRGIPRTSDLAIVDPRAV